MKVFLAGATGVIGRNLLPRLVRAGHEVVGMISDADKSDLVRSLGARPAVVDVFDRDGLKSAVQAASPDAVIDQLTSLHGGDYAANNRVRTEGTRNIVDAAELAGTSVNGPGTAYAADGPVAGQVRRGELPANEDVTSFVHVDDAAEAALQALGWSAGTLNVVDDEPAAGTDWLPAYAAAIGAPPPPVMPGTGAPLRGAANSRARTEFGWKPIHPSWRDGFRTALG